MKLIIDRDELTYLVGNIQNIIGQKLSMPILNNFLVEAYADGLVIITATDLTVSLRCNTKAKVLEGGAITIPAKRFYQLIRELTATSIEISANNDNMIEITANTSRFKLKGMGTEEYPGLPDLSDSVHFEIKQNVLKEMLYSTSFAVSKDENNYILTGILLRIIASNICFVGTDSKRLAKAQTSISADSAVAGEYVIPLKAIDEVIKMLSSDDKNVTVFIMDNKIAFKTDNMLIISKLLTGAFPEFERVIPSKTDISVVLHREELIQLLRQISVFNTEIAHSVCFTFADGEMFINANSMQIGEGQVSMPVNYHGEPLEIAFSPGYFLDILRHIKDETVTMKLEDSYTPGVIVDSSGVLFVIMPMRINGRDE